MPSRTDHPLRIAAGVSPLFAPFGIRGLRLANRIVMSPMTRFFSPGGVPGPDVAAYYRRRAEHGCGLIITEGTWIDHPVASLDTHVPSFFGSALDGWRRVVEGVHEVGGKIAPQLWHVGHPRPSGGERTIGGLLDIPNLDQRSMSPSGYSAPGRRDIEPMSKADIAAVVASYARAANAAAEAGFDAVAIHGGHGYLIDQFLWGKLNHRTDEYGGNLENRARFAAEIVAAVREAIGPDIPIFLRISHWKTLDYGARLAETPENLKRLLMPIAEAGVDVFDCSQRRFWEADFPSSPLNFAGWVKKLTGKATMTVGNVGLNHEDHLASLGFDKTDVSGVANPNLADRLDDLLGRLRAEEFDLVGVGRALISDPAWTEKIRDGRLEELKSFERSATLRLA